MKSIITNIQRFSLADGDGIRTTVFFKGCNMKCSWCHNPETKSCKNELMQYASKCIQCLKCADVCKENAISFSNGRCTVDRIKCTACGKCAEICYAGALVLCGTQMTVEDIMNEVRQDKAYYDTSGGGVTLSGGEVLCQRDFATELAKACHAEGISVAIETNLAFDFEYASSLLKNVDLLMCDLKIYDESAHKLHTGVSNKQIIENIQKADKLGIPVIVRTPLIPGVTDSFENLSVIANEVKKLKNLVRYELLNFNPLGESKYRGLGEENRFESAKPLSPEELDKIRTVLNKTGIQYKII